MFLCFVHPLSGRSKKKDHCLNEKLYPLEETETCPCDEFLSQPYGNWSACILPDPSAPGSLKGWMSHREVKECGQGLRYRAVACIDQQGHLVHPTLCTDSGYTVEVCHIPCPLDCKLSDWSAWSACSASCGSGLKIRSKWLREKAFNAGRPCPRLDLKNQLQVYEAVRCHSECSQYEWKIEAWSICTINTVDDLPNCGEGVQSRKIRSVIEIINQPSSQLRSCFLQFGLINKWGLSESCVVDCPVSCILSDWSSWAECSHSCGSQGRQARSRAVIIQVMENQGSCPHQVFETQPCKGNEKKHMYTNVKEAIFY
ncbi:Thrombospondin type-1 domain-containing protein 7A [Collichthys lucidus]|uniref:Thrombospondin type-1 domain-containing protein 7A n=1 Tax=Collichthys lucidus TaxID=240159 RepID=A0A4U5U1A1_COLLU|nr:Thrombospondin type-1 domain-containing protein 7A [Collichthys lucidus]